LVGAVSTVRLLENSLTGSDIDQAIRREGLFGVILVFQSLTFTRNHFHTWPVFGLGAMKQGSNVQSHELEDGRTAIELESTMFDSKETSRPRSFCIIWKGFNDLHNWRSPCTRKRAYMDPLILGKVPLSQIFTFQTLQGACLPCILPWE
jgi:hypothetical protein